MAIKNRDIALLTRVLPLMQDIVGLEKRYLWERERMYNITSHISGTPGGSHMPTGLDTAFAALSQLACEHLDKIKLYERELRAAEQIINSIPDGTMRSFVVMFYVQQLPAADVQRELNMSEYAYRVTRSAIESAQSMAQVKWKNKFF